METMVILPTFDEAPNLRKLALAILAIDDSYSLCVVDDASPDGTGDIADELARETRRVQVIHRKGKLGLGTAYAEGIALAMRCGAEHIVTMDCDFSHDPVHLPQLVAGMTEHDLMIGSRYIPGGGTRNWSLARRILSRGANFLARRMLGFSARDVTSGYRCYSARVIRTIDPKTIKSNGYSWLEEMLHRVHRQGFSVGETPIIFEDRRAGESKISRSEIFKGMATLWRLFIERFSRTNSRASR